MCGRYTLRTGSSQLVKAFQLDGAPDISSRYNIAPTQDVAAVRLNRETDRRELVFLRWA